MTRKELRGRIAELWRRSGWASVINLTVLCLALASGTVVVLSARRSGTPAWVLVTFVASTFATMFLVRRLGRMLRELGLTCPGCGEHLEARTDILMATDRCGGCGRILVDATSPDVEPARGVARMTRQELVQRSRALRRRERWNELMALAVVVPIGAFYALGADAGLRRLLPPSWGELADGLPVLLIFLILVTMGLWSWRGNRRLGLACPACRKSFVASVKLVVASGRCGECGARILE